MSFANRVRPQMCARATARGRPTETYTGTLRASTGRTFGSERRGTEREGEAQELWPFGYLGRRV